MDAAQFTLFDSAIGRCGIAWSGARVTAFALPDASDSATVEQLRRRSPTVERADPPAPIAAAIESVERLLQGEPADLCPIQVDLNSVPAFERSVYARLREVGPGETVTYGELAVRAGSPGAARAVGAAMARNPIPVIIPVIGCSPAPVAVAASRPPAGSRPNSACSRSSRRADRARRSYSTICRWP